MDQDWNVNQKSSVCLREHEQPLLEAFLLLGLYVTVLEAATGYPWVDEKVSRIRIRLSMDKKIEGSFIYGSTPFFHTPIELRNVRIEPDNDAT